MTVSRSLVYLLSVVTLLCAFLIFALAKLLLGYYSLYKIETAIVDNRRVYEQVEGVHNGGREEKLAIIVGDSRVAKWSPLPEIEGFRTVSFGISGETAAKLKLRIEQDVLRHKPDLVIIQAGVNDVVAASLSQQMRQDIIGTALEALIGITDSARDHGIDVLLIEIVPPTKPSIIRRIVWSETIARDIEATNRSLTAAYHGRSGVKVLSVSESLSVTNGYLPAAYATDTLHLNEVAYIQLNKQIISTIASQNAFQ